MNVPAELMRLSWRERLLLLNSVLFCAVGCGLIIRYVLGQITWLGGILGVVFAAYGGYRLQLAIRIWRRRAGDRHSS